MSNSTYALIFDTNTVAEVPKFFASD
jgi:hypothetical protein